MDCYWSCRLYHFAIIGSCVSLVQGGIAFFCMMKQKMPVRNVGLDNGDEGRKGNQ